MYDLITSSQNSKVKLVRGLLSRSKVRRQEQKIVLEGIRLIEDVLQQGYVPELVLYRSDIDLLDSLGNIESYPVAPEVFDELSETENSQGFLAVVPMPDQPIPSNATLLVALDGVQDPGNVGAILRTSAGAGADGVLLLSGTVDAFNPKVLRAGMGAHFRIPVQSISWKQMVADYGENWQGWRTEISPEAVPYHQADFQPPTIILIGSEAHGISDNAREFTSKSVYIPMQSGVESLNAAVATGVLLFEVQRQRGVL